MTTCGRCARGRDPLLVLVLGVALVCGAGPQRGHADSAAEPPLAPRAVDWGALRAELAFEQRSFVDRGLAGQERLHPSASLVADWYRESADGQHGLGFKGFYRYDVRDQERTHGDLREGYYRFVGSDLELTLGVKQLFWGVSEFNHVIDVVNQTDLVENLDFEDKLGQPMAMLTLQRDWGQLELLLLPVFRERTLPGPDGRLRFTLPYNVDDATYASGAEDRRLDTALRWSSFLGPLSVGIYHFSGTNRDPQFRLEVVDEQLGITPHYTTIDQTGLDAQWLRGDLNLRLELVSRSGDGPRYTAGNVGLEQSIVGLLGSRVDLGLVVEYLFDDRSTQAFNTLFERDLALGARFAFNNLASTELLAGVIWDRVTDETLYNLEGSHQLGANWLLSIEARVFSGLAPRSPMAELAGFLDGTAKSAFLQRDDFLQVELRRFF